MQLYFAWDFVANISPVEVFRHMFQEYVPGTCFMTCNALCYSISFRHRQNRTIGTSMLVPGGKAAVNTSIPYLTQTFKELPTYETDHEHGANRQHLKAVQTIIAEKVDEATKAGNK